MPPLPKSTGRCAGQQANSQPAARHYQRAMFATLLFYIHWRRGYTPDPMKTNALSTLGGVRRKAGSTRVVGWTLALMIAAIGAGTIACGRNAKLAGHDIRDVSVGTISAYGKTLDQDATVQEVLYVLLNAVADDYEATDKVERDKAMEIQFGVCAPAKIKRALAGLRELGEQELKEGLYDAVRHWTPILAFYSHSFRDDFDTLSDRMHVIISEGKEGQQAEADAYLNVPHPNAEDNPNAGAVARFFLVKEQGYWRVWWVGWETTTRNWKEAHLPLRKPASLLKDKGKKHPKGNE